MSFKCTNYGRPEKVKGVPGVILRQALRQFNRFRISLSEVRRKGLPEDPEPTESRSGGTARGDQVKHNSIMDPHRSVVVFNAEIWLREACERRCRLSPLP